MKKMWLQDQSMAPHLKRGSCFFIKPHFLKSRLQSIWGGPKKRGLMPPRFVVFSQSYVTLLHVTLGNKNCDFFFFFESNKNCDLIYAIIEERHRTKNLDKTSTFKIIVTDTSEILCRWHILEYHIFIQFPKQKLFFHFVCLLFQKTLLSTLYFLNSI